MKTTAKTEDKELKSVETELDLLLHHHRFIRTEGDDKDTSHGSQLAKRYYGSLYKEYTIVDLGYYKQGK